MEIPSSPEGRRKTAAKRISHPVGDKAPPLCSRGRTACRIGQAPARVPAQHDCSRKTGGRQQASPTRQGRPLENILTKLGTGIVKGTGL